MYICCPQESHFRPRDRSRLKVRGQTKIFHTNGNPKKTRVAIFISDKIDFKIKRDRKVSFLQETGRSIHND